MPNVKYSFHMSADSDTHKDATERVIRDPLAIRALAHPARLAVLEELSNGEELTATQCAELTGLSPSAMSYHLRALEKYGFVERADVSGDGRERPWHATANRWSTGGEIDDEEYDLATEALVRVTVERIVAEFSAWARVEGSMPKGWKDACSVSNTTVWLTSTEAQAMVKSIDDLFDTVRGRTRADHPQGARRVRLTGFVIPTVEG